MEKQVTCFPHVAVKIFDYLDIRSLAWSRGVCKLWKKFIESSKFSWVKFIKGILKQLKQSEETQRQWKRVLFMADIKQIIGIADTIQESVCNSYDIKQGLLEDFSPLLVLAKVKDSLNLFKDVCRTISYDKINLITNHKNSEGYTCLHLAACCNNVDLFGFIIEKVKDKNPKALPKAVGERYDSVTPLHLAAMYGNLEICKIIIANVDDLSCLDEKTSFGHTPLFGARVNDHLDVFFYLNEVRGQSTLDIGWEFDKNIGLYFPPKESKG